MRFLALVVVFKFELFRLLANGGLSFINWQVPTKWWFYQFTCNSPFLWQDIYREMGFGHYEEEESCWEKQKSEKRDRPQNRSRSRSRERDGHYSNSHKSKYQTDPYERERSKKRDRSRSPKKSKDKEKSKYRWTMKNQTCVANRFTLVWFRVPEVQSLCQSSQRLCLLFFSH